MRSLFLKIFLWFWFSNLLITGISVAFLMATRESGDRREMIGRRGRSSGAAAMLIAPNAVALHEREGAAALAALFQQIEAQSQMKLWLFDGQNRELSGQEVPDVARETAQTLLKKLPEKIASGDNEPERVVKDELLYTARPAKSFRTPGASYVLVTQVPDFGMRGVAGGANTNNNWAWLRFFPLSGPRLVIFLCGAGVVCYALARYLTGPVRQLRRATQSLATGDLTTRVGPRIGRRRDELADLGRDFDLMAERIENLMMSERRLLGDISHELRSPLARLQVALDLAEQSEGEELATLLERIRTESGRLNALIGQLLALSRLENGDRAAREQPVRLDKLIEEIVQDADFEAQSRNRRVKVLHSEPQQITGSAELLRSAVENVVRNAVRYTKEGTDIEVELRRDADQAIISVRDYGPGVPPEALTDLFRPFYRVAEARDRQSGGVGLGLAIAQRAIRSHGGAMKAHNVPSGGLKMEISLPAVSG